MQPEENEYFVTHAPLQFHELPRDVQLQVLQHTHAEFEITHHTEVATVWLASNPAARNREWLVFWESRLQFVPVVKRYEFKLQRRLGGREPEMTARFSRCLDPALKQTTLWHSCPPKLQEGIVRAAAQVVEIEPFSLLKFDELKPGNGSKGLFCFLREDGPQSLAPQWSNFLIDSEVLEQVREKMKNVFGQPFSHVI